MRALQTVQQRFDLFVKAASNASVTNSAVMFWHTRQNNGVRSYEALQTLQTLHILE